MKLFLLEAEYNCMIVSYDTFRIHGAILNTAVDLLICDEGHKIKNRKIKMAKALNDLRTSRRIILTGTPIQNNLEEFFTLIDFINPGIFINYSKFKRVYSDII
jgi:DNA repair and recombination protein RAD54B